MGDRERKTITEEGGGVWLEMAAARRVAYQVSTALVVLLFTLAGVMKLTPLLSPETHGELVGNHIWYGGQVIQLPPPSPITHTHIQKGKFSVYARVPPIDILKLDPNVYRVLVGVVELACVGAILLLEPQLQVRLRLAVSQDRPFLFLSLDH